MLYCEKCRRLSPEGAARCMQCGHRGLRPAKDADEVYVKLVSGAEAEVLRPRFERAGIKCRMARIKAGLAAGVYDPTYMPTDEELFVSFADLERAEAVIRAYEAELAAEEDGEENSNMPDMPEMPRGKRMLVQTVSVLAFLFLVVLVVLGADALANWIRSLL